MNHFTTIDLEELEYGAARIERQSLDLSGYFEEIEPYSELHHLVFFDFSNSDELEKVLYKSLRDNDIIRRRGNCFDIRLEGLSEAAKNAVVGRIMKNLKKEGLYPVVNLNVDASVLEDKEEEARYRIAV